MLPRNESPDPGTGRFRRHVLSILYPALRVLPPQDWDEALRKARSAEFDTLEWTGIVGGAGLVAWLLQLHWPPSTGTAALAVFVLQFPLALVLLTLIVGPLYLRRTRRGLEKEIHQRHRRRGFG
jgi:hypothetical protein